MKLKHVVQCSVANYIRRGLKGIAVTGKCGRDQLQGLIAQYLATHGFRADTEDTEQFLRAGMPVWRSKDSGRVEPTSLRRRIDIVVYSANSPVALVETESDLDDLRRVGVTKRNGHYDVASIARAGDGKYFDSYKSLERMAAAAQFWSQYQSKGTYPSASEGVAGLECICSDRPADHNPNGLELVLVSGTCRAQDGDILQKRLQSLSATLVCVTPRP